MNVFTSFDDLRNLMIIPCPSIVLPGYNYIRIQICIYRILVVKSRPLFIKPLIQTILQSPQSKVNATRASLCPFEPGWTTIVQANSI